MNEIQKHYDKKLFRNASQCCIYININFGITNTKIGYRNVAFKCNWCDKRRDSDGNQWISVKLFIINAIVIG